LTLWIDWCIIQSMTKKSYVYLIHDKTSNAVKIGRSNSVHQRLKELQISNPNKLVVLCVIPCISERHSKEVEIDLHHEYSEYHLRGEWFRYDESVFKRLIQSGIDFTPRKTREPLIITRSTLYGEEEVFNSEKAPQCYFYPKLQAQILDKFENVANRKIAWRTMSWPTKGKQELKPFSEEYDKVFISIRKHRENLLENKDKKLKQPEEVCLVSKKASLDDFI
jgi:hypothetical protein